MGYDMSIFLDSIFDGAVEHFVWSWKKGKNIDHRVNVSGEQDSYQDWIDSLHNVFHVLDSLLYKHSLIGKGRELFMNQQMLDMVSKMRTYIQYDGIHYISHKWIIHIEPWFSNKVLVVNQHVLDAIKTGMYATVDIIDWDYIPAEYRS